jgi:LacI family transcriptional regulator
VKKRRAVALLIETSNAYARGLLRGIVRFGRELQPPWSMHFVEQGRGDPPPAWLTDWDGDGIIARIETPRIAAAVQAMRVPIVDVSAARYVPKVPWVETDDVAIAQLAADHLLERGFRRFAFCGDSAFNWSNWRRDAFVSHLAMRGFEVTLHEDFSRRRGAAPPNRERVNLAAWIRRLAKPVGVFACYDIKAQELLDACRGIRVAVPEELAVISVDNDELFCDLCFPPLTSIVPDSQRAGYEAARLLETLMARKSVPQTTIRVPPLGIMTRQSTDVLAIDDRDIAQALRFVREHACDGISVADVLREIPISRRVFEKRFRQLLGRTPHQEILNMKIARSIKFLTETDLSLATIAERTGFRYPEYLCVAFKRATGRTPGEFRRHSAARGRSAHVDFR